MLKRLVLSSAAVVNLLLLDQIAKAAAVHFLKDGAPIVLLPCFNLAYVENRGCAWGMFQGQVWPLAAFAIVALAFIAWKRRTIFSAGALGTICEIFLWAGILGNLIDRLARGFVVDMLDFHWGVHHFPCFNVADSLITIAAGILVLSSFLQKTAAEEGPNGGT